MSGLMPMSWVAQPFTNAASPTRMHSPPEDEESITGVSGVCAVKEGGGEGAACGIGWPKDTPSENGMVAGAGSGWLDCGKPSERPKSAMPGVAVFTGGVGSGEGATSSAGFPTSAAMRANGLGAPSDTGGGAWVGSGSAKRRGGNAVGFGASGAGASHGKGCETGAGFAIGDAGTAAANGAKGAVGADGAGAMKGSGLSAFSTGA